MESQTIDDARAELAAALNRARVEQHLSIRAAARIAGVPAATMQGWLSGRYFPTPALRGEFVRLAEHLGLGHKVSAAVWRAESVHPSLEDRAPYLGLSPYRVDDADLFFGRDAESDRLGQAVRSVAGTASPIVVVVGGSGCGKSSLVSSGLAGRECLESGSLSGWHPRFLRLAELDEEVGRSQDHGPQVWIIDQVEDALVSGQRWSSRSLSSIPGGVVLVLVVRADAFGRLTDEPALARAVAHPFVVAPLRADDVRQVVRGPLERVGIRVDQALVEMILRDAGITSEDSGLPSGALPLLSNALLATWQSRRVDGPMSVEDYLANGGLPGSVDVLAERVFDRLAPGAGEAARQAFLTLVEVGPDLVLRRSVPRMDLTEEQNGVLAPFRDARLVSLTESDRIEIGHDALLTHWQRLADWIQEDRDSLRALDLVRRAADAWDGHARAPELLLPVTQLPGVQEHVTSDATAPLTRVEQEFVARSAQHFAERLDQERAQNRRLRRQRSLVAGLLVVSVALGAVIGSLALRYRSVQLAAQSRQVASDSVSLSAKDPNLRAQMALIAAKLSGTREADSALIEASGIDVPTRWLGPGSAAVAASADGSVVVRGDGAGTLTLWRDDIENSPGQTVRLPGSTDQIYGVSVAVIGGRTLVAVAGRSIASLWDITGTPRRILDAGLTGTAYAADISTASGLVAFAGVSSTVVLPLNGGRPARNVPMGSTTAALGPDGTLYLGQTSGVSVWKAAPTGYERAGSLTDPSAPAGTRVQSLAISPDGRRLAAGYNAPRVSVFDLASRAVTGATVGGDWINQVAFSPDSAELAVASSDQHTYVLGAGDLTPRRVLADPSKVAGVTWSGPLVVTAGVDGAVRVWRGASPKLRDGGTPVWQFASDATATKWFAAITGGQVLLWKVEGTSFVPMPQPRIPSAVSLGAGVAITPDGSSMVAVGRSGELVFWPLGTSGAATPRVYHLLPAGTNLGSVAFSASGNMVAVTLPTSGTTVVATRAADGSWHQVATLRTLTPLVASFDLDRPILYVGIGANAVTVWDLGAPSHPVLDATIANDATPSVQMPGAGHLLAVGSDIGTVTVWDTSDPTHPVLKQRHRDALSAIYGLSFNPQATMLAAASGDGIEWGWSVPSGRTLFALDGGFGQAYETRFAADGRRLLATGASGIIREWTPVPAAARAELCGEIGDRVTPTEAGRYLPGIGAISPCS